MLLLLLAASGCGRSEAVVVYSSLDPEFSEPLLREYTRATGVEIAAKFDTESTKSVGLAERLIREAPRPRCDLFWNNEILNTLRLKQKGLLASWSPPNATDYPDQFRARDGTWYGFAARARVLLVNTALVPESDRPSGIADLLAPRRKGRIAIAKPLFGTTATHFTCLYAAWGDARADRFLADLKANGVQVLSGNKQVATAVGSGQADFGLTDTDDAIGEVEAGRPVAIIYPDRGLDQLGTLFIPNTLAILKGGPHPEAARALGNALLAAESESKLARGPSAQVPLGRKVQAPSRVETPQTIHAMAVDFEAVAPLWDHVSDRLAAEFAGPGG